MGGSTATPKRTGRTDKYGQLAERKDGFRRYERNGMRMNGLVDQSLDTVEDFATGKMYSPSHRKDPQDFIVTCKTDKKHRDILFIKFVSI